MPVATAQDYNEAVVSGAVDVWMDASGGSEDEASTKYRMSEPYLTTTVSVVRSRGASGKVSTLALADYNTSVKEVLAKNLPEVHVLQFSSEQECL